MKRFAIFFLFSLGLVLSVPPVMADPSANLRVITVDPLAGGFDGSLVFSTSPFDGAAFQISQAGDLPFGGDKIVAFDGDVFASDFTKIIRINLDSSGLAEGGIGNNIDAITGDIFSPGFVVGLTVDSNGILYVADSNEQIFTVDPSDAPSASKTPVSISQGFDDIRDIYIDGNFLYILDVAAGGGDGKIYKVDLSSSTVTTAYSASTGGESLADATAIAVMDSEIFVAGSAFSSFSAGILKITSSGTEEFSDNSTVVLSFPRDLAIDEGGDDLYVSEGTRIYRFSLATTPSQPILEIDDAQISFPVGLSILTISGQVANPELSLEKVVNASQAVPGQGLLYTITATNEGPDPATQIFLHDFFPNGVESVETSPGQLSFTSEIHDVSNNEVIEAGNCERRGGDEFVVDCDSFGTLDAGDFIVVTLEGKVIPGAAGTQTNRAVVENFGENAEATVETTLVSQMSLSKTATPNSVVAGNGFIDYTIEVKNENTVDALDVVITDTLPDGVSELTITSPPTPPSSCTVTSVGDTSVLECGPYIIDNTVGVVQIKYRVNVDTDAAGSIENSVELSCSNCAASQTSTSTTIVRQSDLSIDKVSDTDPVVPGQDSILYTITVGNIDGPSVANDVVITDTLPAGVTFEESDSTECVYNSPNHQVVCELTTPLLVGEERTFTINVSVNADASGELINAANITSSSVDTNGGNNQVIAEPVPVKADTDVSLVKTGPTNAVAGGKITYSLSVSNSGPSAALDVFVQDFLPLGLTLIDHTQPGSLTDPDCFDNSGEIICEFGNMGAGITQTKSIQAQIAIDVTGTVTNEAEVFTNFIDSEPDNNASTLTTTIDPPFCGKAEADYDSIIFGTEGKDNIKGTNGDDLIFGLGGNDKINGKNGDDCIFGGDGDDKIHGGKGNDTIEGNNGDDKIHGQQGDDTLIGGDDDDKIHGGKGNDTIDAGAGNNQIHGNQGNDNITSGTGNDRIWGGQGDDTIDAGSGDNKIHGNQGDDIIISGNGHDWIHAGQGTDVVNAGDGNDKIHGAQGHDELSGEQGDDIIHGGQGNDFIDGGDGYDKCNGAQGNNTIINCEAEDKKMKEDKEEDEEDDEDDDEDDDDDDEEDEEDEDDDDDDDEDDDD